MGLKGFLRIIIIVTVLFFAFLVSIHFTGRVEREYNVTEPDETVLFKNTSLKAENLAKLYLPEFFSLKELQDPKPEMVTYEIIQNNSTYSIVYRIIYPTENVPSFYVDKIYSEFRKLFYGSEKDIEFVQIDTNRGTGKIDRILFQTSSVSPMTLLQIHIPAEIIEYNNEYRINIGKETRYLEKLPVDNTHLQIGAISWNHLFGLPNSTADYVKIGSLPLSFLDREMYKDYKIARRGGGDFKSHENFDAYILFFLLSIFGLIILRHGGLL